MACVLRVRNFSLILVLYMNLEEGVFKALMEITKKGKELEKEEDKEWNNVVNDVINGKGKEDLVILSG